MSDARTDFFSGGAVGKPRDTRQARTDFFSGQTSARFGTGKSFDVGEDGKLIPSEQADYSPSVLASTGESIKDTAEAGAKLVIGIPATVLGQGAGLGAMGYDIIRNAIAHPFSGSTPGDYADPAAIQQFVTQSLTYQPENPESAQSWAADAPGRVIQGAGQELVDLTGARGVPYAESIVERLPEAATYAAGLAGARTQMNAPRAVPEVAPPKPAPKPAPSPQDLLNKQASGQSMGAAGAAVDLQKLSPELRTAVESAVRETGGAVNPQVLARQIQADSLPVKVRLSEGQALGDERLISLEQNAKGRIENYSKGFKAQNDALVENLRVMRDETGPDVFSTNATEHGDTIIGRYKAIDDAARADITAKYKALEEANGGQLPIKGDAFVKAADDALAKKMKTRYLPAEVAGDLADFRANGGMMTFEQFENLRTNLAAAARKAERAGDGNAAGAIRIVRDALESNGMEGLPPELKALADEARSAAKARFDALDADPAYKAAVNETVSPDAFVRKYVINGARDDVAKLAQAMKDDPAALQTLKVATLDHLRQAAGIDAGFNGNFTQAGYNKALQALEPKLGSLLDPKTAETARTLGDVARYTQVQPKGSFVNNSNTYTAAAAEHAGSAVEAYLNMKTGGVASVVKGAFKAKQAEKAAAKSFAPGAGLTKLSDLTKAGKP